MGIDSVPTLLVNDKYQKLTITGRDTIMQYLLACTQLKETGVKTGRTKKANRQAAVPAQGTGSTAIDIFDRPALFTMPSPSTAEDDMCKQDEICK
jgi:hypothetical protein